MHAHLQREDTFTMVETLKYKCFCVQLSHISQAFCSFEKSLDSTNIWSKTVDARAKLQWRKSTDSVRLRHFAACSSVLTLETAYLTFWKEKKKKKVAELLTSLSATTNSTCCQTVCTAHCVLCTGLQLFNGDKKLATLLTETTIEKKKKKNAHLELNYALSLITRSSRAMTINIKLESKRHKKMEAGRTPTHSESILTS